MTRKRSGRNATPKPFGPRLLRARLEYGARLDPPRSISQVEAAAVIGVTGVTLGRWEAGTKEPDAETFGRLATLYRVRAAWIVWGEEPMRDDAPPTTAERAPAPTLPNVPQGTGRLILTPDDVVIPGAAAGAGRTRRAIRGASPASPDETRKRR